MPQKIRLVSAPDPQLVTIADAVRLSETDVPGGKISRSTFDRHIADGSLPTVPHESGKKRFWWPPDDELVRIINLHPKRRAKLMAKANEQSRADMDGKSRRYIGIVDTGLLEQLEEATRREKELNKRISELIVELAATREAHERELVRLHDLLSGRH